MHVLGQLEGFLHSSSARSRGERRRSCLEIGVTIGHHYRYMSKMRPSATKLARLARGLMILAVASLSLHSFLVHFERAGDFHKIVIQSDKDVVAHVEAASEDRDRRDTPKHSDNGFHCCCVSVAALSGHVGGLSLPPIVANVYVPLIASLTFQHDPAGPQRPPETLT